MLTNYSSSNNKVKLWTRQHKQVLKELEENGIYHAKKEYITEKMDDISEYYLKLYDWYVKEAEKIVPRPDEIIKYPIWLSTSSETMLQPTEDTIVLELEVPREYVVITDFERWGYVVNYWYVPLDKEDEKKHNEELKRYGIRDESALYMSHKGNFYPLLRNKIIKSWNRIFDSNLPTSGITQATLWEIKKEWIVNIL
ncbi:DUF3841 domain-containing protein [Clostridium formicaceticum]|uniref:DUF3841 domain-containing protein n=1 Tax=Clostridium formicaceticum TaxID=1497 RepID=A0AAC9RNE4_9CLOT|nr:DUF3841 domain-containing protein [Clostridium formicaceticum]AOY78149.1 hypothetical protein BJL90_21160 [Clostridium formicaceticum]ARE88802.1 hypothetical protein CLFO_32080 [Clostridium formicaceticum]